MGLFKQLQYLREDIKYTIQQTYLADGVDLISKTQNDSHFFFNEPESKAYRNHWGTIVTGILGLPNRQLDPDAKRQTWGNIFMNYFGWRPDASWKKTIARGLTMFAVNTVLWGPRLVLGVAKLATEVVPGSVSRFFLNSGEDIVNSGIEDIKSAMSEDPDDKEYGLGTATLGVLKFLPGGLFYGFGAATKALYLTLCTLTSPIETFRSSVNNGHFISLPFTGNAKDGARTPDYNASMTHKFLGTAGKFFFGALSVIGSVITFALSGPFAVKLLGIALAPVAGKHIATTVTNTIDRVGTIKGVGPVLTKIGEGFNWVLSRPYISNVVNFLRMGPTLQASPAVIGLGAVVGGLVATVGTFVNGFIYRPLVRAWHSVPDEHDEHEQTGLLSRRQPPIDDAGQPLLENAAPAVGASTKNANEELEASKLARAPGEGTGTRRFFDHNTTAAEPAAVAAVRKDVDRPVYQSAANSYR